MQTLCPLCGQPLPEAINADQLRVKIARLAMPLIQTEQKRLDAEFKDKLVAEKEIARQQAERDLRREIVEAKQHAAKVQEQAARDRERLEKAHADEIVAERESARKEAERSLTRELTDARKRLEEAEQRHEKQLDKTRQELESRLKKEAATAVRLATREAESKFEKLQAEKEKDQLRHAAEQAKLQTQLDTLSRKLEKQTAEQLGEEAESDLFVQLAQAFPGDRIERIGRGVKGADILHNVMEGPKVLGRIVYECKNVLNWQNEFIAHAKHYQTQYETPNVIVVSRVFPRKDKDFSVVDGIPVVSQRLAVSLASVIRAGVVDIGNLRLSGKERDGKTEELFNYVVSDKFVTRFREIAEGIASLRALQEKARKWHENTWQAETKIHDCIDNRHREIDAQMRLITQGDMARNKVLELVTAS